MQLALSILFGMAVGLSLALTGGGGSIYAVPLLVYGLGFPPHEAAGISLAAVGATALAGAVPRWINGQVDLRTGLIFAGAGMVGAPFGSAIAARMAPSLMLPLFSLLMFAVAFLMWRRAERGARVAAEAEAYSLAAPSRSPACPRDAQGRLRMTSRCMAILTLAGLGTGALAGMFGVGGGFVIVPALTSLGGMEIHRAVATSLVAVALISLAGVAARLASGQSLDLGAAALFAAGGLIGMAAGSPLARRFSGPALQRAFSVAIVFAAIWVIAKSIAA